MSESPPLSDATCQLCGATITGGAILCPNCGEPRLRLPPASVPKPASSGDIIFGIVTGLLAFLITLPTNYALTQTAWDGGKDDLAFVSVFAGLWNVMVWGIPVIVVGRWWYLGAERGDPEKSYLWRIYWKSQIATFAILVALTILLLTICAAAIQA